MIKQALIWTGALLLFISGTLANVSRRYGLAILVLLFVSAVVFSAVQASAFFIQPDGADEYERVHEEGEDRGEELLLGYADPSTDASVNIVENVEFYPIAFQALDENLEAELLSPEAIGRFVTDPFAPLLGTSGETYIDPAEATPLDYIDFVGQVSDGLAGDGDGNPKNSIAILNIRGLSGGGSKVVAQMGQDVNVAGETVKLQRIDDDILYVVSGGIVSPIPLQPYMDVTTVVSGDGGSQGAGSGDELGDIQSPEDLLEELETEL